MMDEKLASVIAREIEEHVVALGWPIGHKLGREPELIKRYHCSRQVIREAIRLLEFHGVARMRTGPGGGLIVTPPDPRNLARSVALFLDYASVDIHHISMLRRRLELDALEAVIERLDAAGEARLLSCLAADKIRPADAPVAEAQDLHSVLAELSGNAALALFIGVLVNFAQRKAQIPANRAYFSRHPEHGYDEHREIIEAIIARDKSRALALMYRHLEVLEKVL